MKRNLLLIAIFTLLPLYAFGTYEPGRIRLAAHAELSRDWADGRYAEIKGARALEFRTDGVGITDFQISLDRGALIPFRVLRVQANQCGRAFLTANSEKKRPSRMRIEEIAPAPSCRNPGAARWRVTLTTNENDGALSHLVLYGNPIFLRLSQKTPRRSGGPPVLGNQD